MRELTDEEQKAIRSLQRLARTWPQTLKLFSWAGSLVVIYNGDSLLDSYDPNDLVLDTIPGIPNDGGDP